MVVYAGRAAELGSSSTVFGGPAHPYTRKLLEAIPDPTLRREWGVIRGSAPSPGARPPAGCMFAPRCDLAVDQCLQAAPPAGAVGPGHLSWCIRTSALRELPPALRGDAPPVRAVSGTPVLEVEDVRASYGQTEILKGVSLSVRPGECLAIVGESGSGKTTLARSIVGLMANWSGEIRLEGQQLAGRARSRPPEVRRALQYVFQNPFASLNPRRTVGDAIAMPLREFTRMSRAETSAAIAEALERVALPASIARRYPAHLSGGERQRVAIARALVSEPRVLVCDEITSSLDVSVQAMILRLLDRLRSDEQQLSLLFVTHNLGLVRSVADRVLVMHHGQVVEHAETERLFTDPQQDYTRRLLADTPSLLGPTSSERRALATGQ
jgi:peptide/nickel transport system ATP-binding protein